MDYRLKPPGKTCAGTGRPLVPGEVCHSVLIEKEGHLVRFDYSDAGWSEPPKGHVGYWKTTTPAVTDAPTQTLDAESAQRYFEQLSEEASPTHDRQRYVLALILLQQRRLRLENTREDGDDEFLELSGRHGEGSFEVRNLKLSDADTQQLQVELKSHLSTEWS
ncbi:MAG: hypothetical protein NTW75_03000 [Planctomycetales bacterium]|jgi:hypothetical protein|nr:hypothetical protein [Planctomycetales bacterium]